MAVAAIRRENESSEKLISRWNKKTQGARVVARFKRIARRDLKEEKKKRNPRVIKTAAIMRAKHRAVRKKASFYG